MTLILSVIKHSESFGVVFQSVLKLKPVFGNKTKKMENKKKKFLQMFARNVSLYFDVRNAT